MRFRLKRVTKSIECTAGVLINEADGLPVCVTLENPWVNNKPYVSCIPKGLYSGIPFSGLRFKNVYILQNVDNRSNILMHIGNTASHTSGCILLGSRFGLLKGKVAVLESTAAFAVFSGLLDGNGFELIVCY